MFRKTLLCLTAVLIGALTGTAQSPKKSALDKATLEAYVRHLFVMGPQINVEIAEPKPSTTLPGFLDVKVHASAGQMFQDFSFLVSKDGSKILQANVYDIASNPFKPELDKIKTEGAASFGTQGAPVVIVEFSDFECPYCKEEATMLRQNLLSSYPTQVHLYFKEFPLESIHPWSKPAAMAARCIYRQKPDEYWKFHDWIFGQQERITPENFKTNVIDWAKNEKDLDAVQLAGCMDSKATEAEVDKTIAEGKALGVNSTPTLFVNGRRIAQTIDWPNLRSIIDYEIDYQKTAKNAGEDCGCDFKLNVPGMPQEKSTLPLQKKK